MADPKDEVAPAYGEGDAEARSMTEAAKGARQPASPAKVPPPDTAVPGFGTTDADIARNLKEKAARITKS